MGSETATPNAPLSTFSFFCLASPGQKLTNPSERLRRSSTTHYENARPAAGRFVLQSRTGTSGCGVGVLGVEVDRAELRFGARGGDNTDGEAVPPGLLACRGQRSTRTWSRG